MTAAASTKKTHMYNMYTSSEVQSSLVQRAVDALLKHQLAKQEQEAQSKGKVSLGLEDNERILLQFGLAKIPQAASSKPVRIDIPHPIYKIMSTSTSTSTSMKEGDMEEDGLDQAEICIIVKQEAKPWVQDMCAKFPSHLSCVKKVLGLDSLRRKYAQYEQRRELLSRFDVFLADDRILPMLGKLLGKNFFAVKKQPIPIKLTRKEAFPFAVEKCLKSTYLFMPSGTCLGIR